MPFYEFEDKCQLVDPKAFVPFGSEIPSGSLVVGSPAVVVKEITTAQLNQIKQGLSIYQDLTRCYLKSFSFTGVSNGSRETLGVDH